jgi:hypothetical protein
MSLRESKSALNSIATFRSYVTLVRDLQHVRTHHLQYVRTLSNLPLQKHIFISRKPNILTPSQESLKNGRHGGPRLAAVRKSSSIPPKLNTYTGVSSVGDESQTDKKIEPWQVLTRLQDKQILVRRAKEYSFGDMKVDPGFLHLRCHSGLSTSPRESNTNT